MRSGLLALIIAGCAAPAAFVPVREPVVRDEPVAPGIVIPIQAETEYAALDPHDPRLDRACDELAYVAAHGGNVTNDLATAVLRMHGIVDPPQTVLAGAAGDALDVNFGEDLYRPNALVGKGAFEHTAVEILIFLPNIRIAPVARATELGVELAVMLDPALRDPRVTVADENESFHPVVSDDEHVVHAIVPCGAQPGERYITIEATDPRSHTTPFVIFPIYCNVQAPTSFVAEPPRNLSAYTDLPGRITAILNRERATVGVPRLLRDARIEAAALLYAQARSENGHTDRSVVMRKAGLLAPAMSWTTFHVDSLESAIDRIVNHPEQLDKLRDRSRTHVGVGANRVADGWWITIIYVTIPPPIDTAREARRIANAIKEWALEHALDIPAKIDPDRNLQASGIAEALAVGWSLDDLHVLGEVAVERRIELAGLDLAKLLEKHVVHTIGVGVAQSARNGPLAGTIWLVVLFY